MRIAVLWTALLLPGAAWVTHAGTLCDCWIGKVAAFDIDMRQLPNPYATRDIAEILRQMGLYPLGPTFSTRTFQSNRECGQIIKIDPALSLVPGRLRYGQARNFAPDGPIKWLDYLFAGEVVIQGGTYVVTVRLEAAITREVVKAATVSIPIVEAPPTQSGPPLALLGATLQHMHTASESLAAAFRPVGPLIAEWETRKRSSDPGIARANPDATLSVKPERRRMKKGETIRVDLELTDCDGELLGNRRIRFSPGEVAGMPIPGTTGGSVSPQSVTTDGAGRATVRFTATANSGTAFIRSWFGLRRPSGHPGAAYGEAPVVITPDQPPPPEPVESIKRPVRHWKGTVTVTTSIDHQQRHGEGRGTVKTKGSSQLTCQLLGVGDDATCSYSANTVMEGERGSYTTQANASQVRAGVSVSVADGKLTLRIGVIPITVTAQSSVPVSMGGPETGTLSSQSHVVPASPDPNRQSGSWTDPDPILAKLGATRVVTWNLSRQ